MSFPHTYGCVWRNAKRNNKFWNYPLCASIVKILPSETRLPRRRYVSNVFARPSFYRWFHFDFYYEQKKMLLLKLSPDATCTPVYKLWVTEQKFQWYGHLCLFRIHARPFGEMAKKKLVRTPRTLWTFFENLTFVGPVAPEKTHVWSFFLITIIDCVYVVYAVNNNN